jgi:uncharacterized membrane protein HdeD (DUF308 family)
MMKRTLTYNWWMLALRGLLSIAFGALAFLWPAFGLLVIAYLFGIYATLDGVLAVVAALTGKSQERPWWSLILEGVFGVSAGVLTFIWPEVTLLVILAMIAFWAVATGVFQIVAAIRLRDEIEGEWLLGLGGVLSICFGLAMIVVPDFGLWAIAFMVAVFSLVSGALMLVLAFRMMRIEHTPARTRPRDTLGS